MPAAADVGEEADAGLRHGEGGPLGGDAPPRRRRDADPAAHGDPVHHRDDRLGIGEEQVVEAVFGEEEFARRRAALPRAVGEKADVAAGAEAALAGMVDQHRLDAGVAAPREQGLDHQPAHAKRQGAERLGPVQRQPPDPALDARQNLRLGLAHFKSSRAMITRMISLVPSRIWCTRRSRTIRSSG